MARVGSIGLHRQKRRVTLNSIRGSNHRRDTVSSLLKYDQGRVPDLPHRDRVYTPTGKPQIDNRLNLRNELDSLGIEDFFERTDHHLPYPLRRIRQRIPVMSLSFGEVDTSSTSSGCLRPKIDWEKQVWVEVRHRIEELGKVPGPRLRLGGLNNVPRRCDRNALRR